MIAATLAVFMLVSCGVNTDGGKDDNGKTVTTTADNSGTPGTEEPGKTTEREDSDHSDPGEPEVTTDGSGDTQPSRGGEIRKSGSFMSENEDKIKLYIEWESVSPVDSNAADVTVRVYLQSYTLNVGERNDGRITFGDTELKFASSAINITEAALTRTLLTEQTLTSVTSADGECDLEISWHFNGSYSGEKIDYITASDTIKTK